MGKFLSKFLFAVFLSLLVLLVSLLYIQNSDLLSTIINYKQVPPPVNYCQIVNYIGSGVDLGVEQYISNESVRMIKYSAVINKLTKTEDAFFVETTTKIKDDWVNVNFFLGKPEERKIAVNILSGSKEEAYHSYKTEKTSTIADILKEGDQVIIMSIVYLDYDGCPFKEDCLYYSDIYNQYLKGNQIADNAVFGDGSLFSGKTKNITVGPVLNMIIQSGNPES